MDIPSDRLIRMACEFLGRHNRVVMEVSINKAGTRPPDSQVPGPVRAVLTGPTQPNNPTAFPEQNTGDTRDGYCPKCKFRRINSVCSNSRCKGCCFQEGHWSCSVHKKDGPVRLEPGPSASTAPSAIAAAGIAQRSVHPTGPQGQTVPCAFCNRLIPIQGTQLAFHIQSCRATFFDQYPQARKLSVAGLHHFAWSSARPNHPIPPINMAPTAPVAHQALAPVHPKSEIIRPPTAGFPPAEIARALAWEQSVKDLPEHIEAILPAPQMRRSRRGGLLTKRKSDEEFQELCKKARRDSQAYIEEALERYKTVIEDFRIMFGAKQDEPDPPERSLIVRQIHNLCKQSVVQQTNRLKESIARDRSEFEASILREKESGERSFGLVQQLRIVQNSSQLKTVAGRFTMHHWLGWRARMPTHVQRRSRLPLIYCAGVAPVFASLDPVRSTQK